MSNQNIRAVLLLFGLIWTCRPCTLLGRYERPPRPPPSPQEARKPTAIQNSRVFWQAVKILEVYFWPIRDSDLCVCPRSWRTLHLAPGWNRWSDSIAATERHIRKNRQNSVEMGCRHFGVIRSPSPFSPSMVARVARVADAPGIAPVQSWQRYRLETFQNNNLGILSAEIIRVRGWEIIRAAGPAMSWDFWLEMPLLSPSLD